MNIVNFNTISIKNFMKYGNKPVVFNFNKGINLIVGNNGAGKSSIFIALHYALFGKTYNGKTINSLVNNINKKEMVVELDFTVNNDSYKIIRGIAPAVFQIFKNNEMLPILSTNTAYQEYLETSILKTTEQAFKNLIYLGGDLLSQSFLRLSKKDKEEVFSILSDTSVFLELQDRIKTLKKEKLTEYTNEKFNLNNLINLLNNETNNYNTQMVNYNEFSETQKKSTDEIKEKIFKKSLEEQREYIADYFAKTDNVKDDVMWIGIENKKKKEIG